MNLYLGSDWFSARLSTTCRLVFRTVSNYYCFCVSKSRWGFKIIIEKNIDLSNSLNSLKSLSNRLNSLKSLTFLVPTSVYEL